MIDKKWCAYDSVQITVNWMYRIWVYGFGLFIGQNKVKLCEIAMGIFHYFLTFYRLNNKAINRKKQWWDYKSFKKSLVAVKIMSCSEVSLKIVCMAFTACCLILIGRTPPGLTHKRPFISPPHMAATDNDTDKNFIKKNVISNHPSYFCRSLKTTAATLSPALTRMTAPHPITSSTAAAPPTGPTKIMGPMATWQDPHMPMNTD